MSRNKVLLDRRRARSRRRRIVPRVAPRMERVNLEYLGDYEITDAGGTFIPVDSKDYLRGLVPKGPVEINGRWSTDEALEEDVRTTVRFLPESKSLQVPDELLRRIGGNPEAWPLLEGSSDVRVVPVTVTIEEHDL